MERDDKDERFTQYTSVSGRQITPFSNTCQHKKKKIYIRNNLVFLLNKK